MRKTIVLLFLSLVVPIAGVSQVMTCETDYEGPGKNVPGSPAPIFDLKKPFKHPAALPDHVLALLRADEANARKFEACRSRGNLPQIPPEWFLATEIKLTDDELPGLIVKAANTCLWDKDGEEELGDFWVFRQAPTGYQLLLTTHTQTLQALNTQTGGYPDFCTTRSIALHDFSQTVYTFREGKYLRTIDRHVIVDSFPAPH